MVPSLTAVDGGGVPVTPDSCTATSVVATICAPDIPWRAVSCSRSFAGRRGEAPDATAVLAGAGGREQRPRRRAGAGHDDRRHRVPAVRLEGMGRRDRRRRRRARRPAPEAGADRVRVRRRVGGPDGPELASGCIDAFAEQLVAGADDDGDVLVILGTTLIVWAVTSREDPVPDHYVIPHTAPGQGARRRTEQCGRLVPQLGRRSARRWSTADRPRARAGVGAVPPRRAGAPQRSRAPGGAGRPRPHAHGGGDPACCVRGVGVHHPPHDRCVQGRRAPNRGDRRRDARSISGCRPSPTPPPCPSTASRCRKAARSVRRGWRASRPGWRSRLR